jgi:threonine synthase
MPIKYYSTNRNLKDGFKRNVSFEEALFTGMAPDNGLFMPDRIPKFSKKEILALNKKAYNKVAYAVLKKFLLEIKNLKQLAKSAYDFTIPIEKIDDRIFLARMDNGPTASFKDFAARMMARLMKELKPKNKNITILVATSGDTGSAIGEAYRGIKGIKVYILYPEEEVSLTQKRQLDSIGMNVSAISVKGKFDDCQRLVKEAFSDSELNDLNLTSANSINVGRILPQIVYYFYIYANTVRNFEKVTFSIPSGNFGNSLGCEIARRMGLPVERIILAVNENDEFPRFLKTGEYKPIVPSKACLSNAMNVGNPSNLARYFELYSGTVDKGGTVHKNPRLNEMKKHLYSVAISDEKTIMTIKKYYKNKKILLEPHGAVGVAAIEIYLEKNKKQTAICLETADPAKFPEIIVKELGIKPKEPASFAKIEKRTAHCDKINNDYAELKNYLVKQWTK